MQQCNFQTESFDTQNGALCKNGHVFNIETKCTLAHIYSTYPKPARVSLPPYTYILTIWMFRMTVNGDM
jgi:hypothetical protein